MSKVLIKSVGDSFRRCGITFTREGVVIDTNDFTVEQQQLLENESQLRVERYVEPESEPVPLTDDEPTGKPAKPAKAAK